MKPRITFSIKPDGAFDISLNEAGRALLIQQLQALNERREHFHLDHNDWEGGADHTDVPLAAVPYDPQDRVLRNGKVLFRPDEWDLKYYPHVMVEAGGIAPASPD